MTDHIVVDVEIQKTIEETPGGWDATDKLGVSCACVWEYRTQRMRIYGPPDVEALRTRLLEADRISGFNIWRFDFPVIWGFSRHEWDGKGTEDEGRVFDAYRLQEKLLPKTNDLLRRIWQGLDLDPDRFDPRTHGGWGLDAVVRATLGSPGKIGYGGDAPKWFQAGLWAKVANYCADDVSLEKELTDFVDREGYVTNGKQTVRLR